MVPRPRAGPHRLPRAARDRVPRLAARDDGRQGAPPGPCRSEERSAEARPPARRRRRVVTRSLATSATARTLRSLELEDADELFELVDANRDRLRPWMHVGRRHDARRATRARSSSGARRSETRPRGDRHLGRRAGWPAAIGLRVDPFANSWARSGTGSGPEYEGRGLVTRACARFDRASGSATSACIGSISARRRRTIAEPRRSPERLGFTRGGRARGEARVAVDGYHDLVRHTGSSRTNGGPPLSGGFDAASSTCSGRWCRSSRATSSSTTVRAMARRARRGPDAFEAAWTATAIERQTGRVRRRSRRTCARSARRSAPARGRRDRPGARGPRATMYRRWFHPAGRRHRDARRAQARGYPIALISMCAPDTPAMWRASPLAPLVDVEVFSSEVGLRKPDAAIYRLAATALGVDAGRVPVLRRRRVRRALGRRGGGDDRRT